MGSKSTTTFLLIIAFALAVALLSSGLVTPAAHATTSRTLEATYDGTSVANGWAKVERWRDGGAGFVAEDYPPDGRGDQNGQRLTFFGGAARPDSSRFLLYYAPGYDTNPVSTPVLLVHGANDNADRAWANPNELGSYGCGAFSCPNTGMMQYLSAGGYKVFAINFPHKQGDNFYWAEQIHDAVEIIKERTGAPNVDVVGWSKGAFASRMYVSSVRQSWGTPYAGDVRKLLLLGNPNEGFDYIFRHGWSHDFSIFPECGGTVNAGAPHTQVVCYGLSRYHPELSIYKTPAGDFYPGQRQMLARWDGVYPLPTYEQDWYTTYYGGQGFYSYGYGIDQAIAQSSLVGQILNAGVPASVPTYLLSGDLNNIPTIHDEHTGPSDGVLFIDSSSSPRGIANLAARSTVFLNHLELGWGAPAEEQVSTWLGR